MSRATATRLRKLEAATEAARKPHIFIVEDLEPGERRAQINELVAAGLATPTDLFIHTGVPRSSKSPFRGGSVKDASERDPNGRRILDPSPA